jgi:hypothetical protein
MEPVRQERREITKTKRAYNPKDESRPRLGMMDGVFPTPRVLEGSRFGAN